MCVVPSVRAQQAKEKNRRRKSVVAVVKHAYERRLYQSLAHLRRPRHEGKEKPRKTAEEQPEKARARQNACPTVAVSPSQCVCLHKRKGDSKGGASVVVALHKRCVQRHTTPFFLREEEKFWSVGILVFFFQLFTPTYEQSGNLIFCFVLCNEEKVFLFRTSTETSTSQER